MFCTPPSQLLDPISYINKRDRGLKFEIHRDILPLCCLWECHLYGEDLKTGIRERKIPILSYFSIFTAPYLKSYLRYAYETFRYHRKFTCVCISQISDLYLFFCVRYRVSKLGSGNAKYQFWAIFPFSLLHISKVI